MTSFAQRNPFNSGSAWESMRFPAVADTSALAGTGNYGNMFGMDEIRSLYSSIPKEATPEERLIFGMYGINALNRKENLAMMPQILLMTSDIQRENALEANKIAQENAVLGSFLKDVPAAISNAFAQRERYTPERIQIAANAANRPLPGYGMPSYYGFVG